MFRTFNDKQAGENRDDWRFEGTGILTEISLPHDDDNIRLTFNTQDEHEEVTVRAHKSFPSSDFVNVGLEYRFAGSLEHGSGDLNLDSISDVNYGIGKSAFSVPDDGTRIEREQGIGFLTDPFEQIVLGDQHHADAIDGLRKARDKAFVLIIENSDDPMNWTLYSYAPNSNSGAQLHRLATTLHNAAQRYFALAQHVSMDYMAQALMDPDRATLIGEPEDDEPQDDEA